jgi:CBS domain-containing protein
VWQLLSGRLSPFLLLLGWFLLVNARGEEYVHRVRGALGTLRVGEVMSPVPPAVPDHLTVQEVLDDSWRFAGRDLLGVRRFDGTVSGLVSLDRLRRIPASDRHRVRIAEVAVDLEHLGNAVAAEAVTEVLGRMTPQLPVIAVWGPGWRLDGLLTADDVRRAMDRGTAARRRAPLPA